MLLPINWLKQFVSVTESPEQVAQRFIDLGFEAELHSENVIDLDITPNRGDCLSILGLAREYAASTNQTLQMPEFGFLEEDRGNMPSTSFVGELSAYHRISAADISDVSVQSSPDWLREAVESVGMNSINTIVDLTNYVMFELGIPMHAFDRDALPEPKLRIRLSQEGETFVSLKDETIALTKNSIVVESGDEIIDLLGIRGGQSTMITNETKNLFVWAVSVPRPLIRQTVKKTGLRTEGAYRHERETDWEMTKYAVARFNALLQKVGGGQSTSIVTLAPHKLEPKKITLVPEKVNHLLGTSYSPEQIVSALNSLGFEVNGNEVTVPSWRYFDITCSEDLVEEAARICGYREIPRQVITRIEGPAETRWAQIENLKDQLAEAGLTEAYTESFSGKEEVKLMGFDHDQLDVLANPVNRDFAYCRPSIIPNLVRLLALNSWSDDGAVFEIANIFPRNMLEQTVVAIAAYGKQEKRLQQVVPVEAISIIGVDDPIAKLYKLRRPITVAEVPVDTLLEGRPAQFNTVLIKPHYRPVSPFPPSVRDIALIVDESLDPQTLITTVYDIASEHVVLVELFDQFRSDKFGPNKQSIALHVVYQAVDKTLDAAEVDSIHQQIITKLIQEFQAEIR